MLKYMRRRKETNERNVTHKEENFKNHKNKTSVLKIIKHLKTNISRKIKYSIWQKSFYEHIVRNSKEYIKNNVLIWPKDKYF